jgi:branched-chain amino acid transport system substrate-binding protein
MPEPIRVGVLNDTGAPSSIGVDRWIRLVVDDLRQAGRLDRDVELVQATCLGLPHGTAAAVERAFKELIAQDVLMVVGPAIGDDALALTPLVERAEVPTINWSGAERARGEHMFHLQVGSHEDESVVIARHLATQVWRIGVVVDRSPIGRRHLQYLEEEAMAVRLNVAATAMVDPLATQARDEVKRLVDADVDALVYLGLGHSAPAVAAAAVELGWDGPSVMNTAGMRGHSPDWTGRLDGWAYVDMYADDNRTLAAVRDRLGHDQATPMPTAVGYDLARLVGEGLARAPELTRPGVRDGLEQVKWLPAAEGHEGTLLGFGIRDRGALHGRYLVLRRWEGSVSVPLDGEGGRRPPAA